MDYLASKLRILKRTTPLESHTKTTEIECLLISHRAGHREAPACLKDLMDIWGIWESFPCNKPSENEQNKYANQGKRVQPRFMVLQDGWLSARVLE